MNGVSMLQMVGNSYKNTQLHSSESDFIPLKELYTTKFSSSYVLPTILDATARHLISPPL